MKTNRKIALLLLGALCANLLIACGDTETKQSDTTTSSSDSQGGDTTAEEYVYPDKTYGGYEFRVFNIHNMWECYMNLDLDTITGDVVDDAVYNRNRLVEQKLDIKIKEMAVEYPGYGNVPRLINTIQQSILANDDEYDAAYLPIGFSPSIITEGYLVDLNTIPELNLDSEWWDTTLNNALEINNKLYAATSPLHLMSLDMTWCLFFNKSIFDDNKLEYPYELVRSGEWTLDKMNEYVSAITSLNGDDSFTYSESGNAIYGVAGHTSAPIALTFSSGNTIISSGKTPEFIADNERLYNTIDKCISLLSVSDGHCRFDNSGISTPGSYYHLFVNDRAGFLTAELKSSLVMRDMKSEYGILPMPKLDAEQSEYVSYTTDTICRLTVPITNTDLSRTGTILDALSYESCKSVLPVYYDKAISQKGLRDDDSIEMLDLINSTRMCEMGMIYGITTEFFGKLCGMVTGGENTMASAIATYSNAINENLSTLMEFYNN